MQKITLIGATSAIAEHCARIWVQQSPKHIVLAGRDGSKLERIAQDLKVRSPLSRVNVEVINFIDPVMIRNWVDNQAAEGLTDIVLIAHGSLPDQSSCEHDLVLAAEAITVNGLSPVMFAEAFAGHMQRSNHGTIALIGSVAGDRGRKSNYVYGSAKGLITRYAQGLQHRLAGTAVAVVLIKPGPTETPMTAHLRNDGLKLAAVEDVATAICFAIKIRKAAIYVPKKWFPIMLIIQHLPRFIFNKLKI